MRGDYQLQFANGADHGVSETRTSARSNRGRPALGGADGLQLEAVVQFATAPTSAQVAALHIIGTITGSIQQGNFTYSSFHWRIWRGSMM